MDKFEACVSEYNALLSFLRGRIAGLDEDAALSYCIAAVLKIWSGNLLYAPDYGALLSALCREPVSVEQAVTALGCCGDPERKLKIPAFFRTLVKQDKKAGTAYAAEAVEKLNGFFVAAAMINGDFTMEEANILQGVITSLTDFARAAGVRPPSAPVYRSLITEKSETGYLQNDGLAAPDSVPETDENQEEEEEQEAPMEIEIPLTVSVELEDGTRLPDEIVKSLLTGEPEEAQPEDIPPVKKTVPEENETMESLLAELDGLVGLESVKRDVHSLMNFIKVAKIREKRGMKVPTVSYHLVFTGNPGTGKTTVARLVAKLYYHLGILPRGQLVETDRSALVAGYLGQTAIKTQKVIQEAMGGVLFIDEAYSLAGDAEDSYGREAIETILKAMEDHRGELVVIVAGYTDLMHKFIDSNPGLSSRFNKYFEYPDYSGAELLAIFRRFCDRNGYVLAEDASELLKNTFDALYAGRDAHFGNARTARNLFEKAINAQADRIAAKPSLTDDDLMRLTAQDIEAAGGGQ